MPEHRAAVIGAAGFGGAVAAAILSRHPSVELTAVTAVLLGGVSIFGGRGTIAGVILALFLLGGIQKALLLSESISSYWVRIVTGALLVGSVLAPNLARRVADIRRRKSHPLQEVGS